MTGVGMRHDTTYRAMISGDQQHACQSAKWRDAARSFFNRRQPQGSGWGCGGFLDGLRPHDVTQEHGAV